MLRRTECKIFCVEKGLFVAPCQLRQGLISESMVFLKWASLRMALLFSLLTAIIPVARAHSETSEDAAE